MNFWQILRRACSMLAWLCLWIWVSTALPQTILQPIGTAVEQIGAQADGGCQQATLRIQETLADRFVPANGSQQELPFLAYPRVEGYHSTARYTVIDQHKIECRLTVTRAESAQLPFHFYFCSAPTPEINLVLFDSGRLLDKLTPVQYITPSIFPQYASTAQSFKSAEWIGIDQVYWIGAIKVHARDVIVQPCSIGAPGYTGQLHGWRVCLERELAPGATTEVLITLLVTPKTIVALAAAKHDFTRIDWTLRLGVLGVFFKPLTELLADIAEWLFAPGLLGHALLLLILLARILLACFVVTPDPRAFESGTQTPQAIAATRSALAHIMTQLLMTYIAYVFTSGLIEMTCEPWWWLANLSSVDESNALSLVCNPAIPFFSITTCACVLLACLNQLHECFYYNRPLWDPKNLLLPVLMLFTQYTRAIFGLIFIINTLVALCAGAIKCCGRLLVRPNR